jgi:hypothetical protein|tara:strand:- start:996 stop:1220 length:225 start_codon:yes stop_codon:yes gene_type:complete
MEELKTLSVEIIKLLDNGDLMGCYSLFESAIRPILGDLDANEQLVKIWNVQAGYVDEEDWAAVMENIENVRPLV